MFSHGTYTKTNVTGQPVFGSLYDYYLEQSFGHLHVEGKAFDYVEVSKNRADYSTGNRMALLTEGLDKLLAREGKDALKDFDGVFFLAAARFRRGVAVPLLAASRHRHTQGSSLAILHLSRGRAADGQHQRLLP